MRTGSAPRRPKRRRRCGRLIASACRASSRGSSRAWPAPRTDRKDPYAIRSALLLVLVVAALACVRRQWQDRLRAAFAPGATSTPALLRLDAWVTPPIYTGMAPIVLADGNEKVGAGAEIVPRAVGARAERIDRAHPCAARRDREPQTPAGRREPRPRPSNRSKAAARAGRVHRGADRAAQRRCQDRRPDGVQMAVRSDQGRGAQDRSDGHADHDAARRPAPGVSGRRRSTAWRAPRRASRSARARSAISRRCRPRRPPSSTPIPCSSRR